eukprot:TRINITY_DN63565_c0_g1_i1.p1 TRINITY_DN63565_c0_g1~~TRINITY_DN63565_c0_g1_i1.p1  ORF type:complete len:691 (-),score=151.14 TRINITY_DN63565_c0_g1_i1:78-2150(-)
MGKGGKGKGGGGGGYPWWEHVKKGGGGGGNKSGHDNYGYGGRDDVRDERDGNGGGGRGGVPRGPVGPKSKLQKQLEDMEGRQYPVYKDLCGAGWDIEGKAMTILFDRVQGDAFAPPSWVRARVPMSAAGFPRQMVTGSRVRNMALCDFVTRVLSDLLSGGKGTDWTQAVQGSGWGGSKGGDLKVDTPGQYVIERSSVVANQDFVEARLTLSLPARGRSIEGYRASDIVGGLIDAVQGSLFFKSLDSEVLQKHIETVEDQEALRSALSSMGLIAFVANGAILPRKSGVDDRPMTSKDSKDLVRFKSPPSMEVTIELPHAATVSGMGIKRGISVIVGGGFHGKSTLLQALQMGIYNKVPGDGREFVVCDPNAVKIRAEDGRSVKCTNISSFINNLPFGKDTTRFTTADASGSTSQATNIMEALEVGATTLLVDEDTCATNFMIRDEKMKALVAPEKEPITAFVMKVRPLFDEHGVSTVLVVGGSGDFFSQADTVVMMDEYAALDVTERATEIGSKAPPLPKVKFGPICHRRIVKRGLAADGKVAARSLRCIQYGETEVELSCIEQLVEISQARAIGDICQRLGDGCHLDGDRSGGDGRLFSEVVRDVERLIRAEGKEIGTQGLDNLSRGREPCPFYVMPRRFEIAAAVNRLRTAVFQDDGGGVGEVRATAGRDDSNDRGGRGSRGGADRSAW